MRGIIFDFDGVIQNTFQFHLAKTREFTGAEFSEKQFRDIHNGNFFESAKEHLRDVEWTGYKDFIYSEFSALKIESAVKDVLLSLRQKNLLFIVSSGGTRNISDYLRNNGIDNVFKEVLGLEFHASKVDKFKFLLNEYKLRAEDCVFVTDTLGDILEANAVNIKTIAVDFGYHDRETLAQGKPMAIISDFEEILVYLD